MIIGVDEVGKFDERYNIEFQDIDLCLKVIEKGYKVIYNPASVLYHICAATRGNPTADVAKSDRSYFTVKWEDVLKNDDPFAIGQFLDKKKHHFMEFYKRFFVDYHKDINQDRIKKVILPQIEKKAEVK